MLRISSLLGVLVLVVIVAVACQPIQAEVAKAQVATQSAVVDGVGPSTASDPAQAQAEDEFREIVLAKERAYYDEDLDRHYSFYADDVISLEPETPDKVGKTVLSEGMQSFFDAYDTVGTFTLKRIWVSGDYATRWGEWEEVVTPVDGGKPIHQIGRCFLGWQKIDGEWKVVSQIVNFIVPPTEMD